MVLHNVLDMLMIHGMTLASARMYIYLNIQELNTYH